MTEWKIPQEMLDQSEEIKRLHAVISRLHAERRTNAIDGQCALDEANNRIVELEAENKGLEAKYKALENNMVLQATILCAVEDVLSHNEVSDFMESFPIVRGVMDLVAQAQLKQEGL